MRSPPFAAPWIVVAANLVGVTTGGCACGAPGRVTCPPGLSNLGKVDDGLWRSAQPTGVGFRSAGALRIRTVVDLRAGHSDAPALAGTGIRSVSIPMHQCDVSEDDLVAFLTVATDPAMRPVLVHCAEGRDRTGVCVAAYRMAIEGWSLDDARREMRSYGAMPWWVNLDRLLRRIDPVELRVRAIARRPATPIRGEPIKGTVP